MTVTEFDAGKQAIFRVAIAAAAGVSNADVTIVKVESISGAQRAGGITTPRRRLLAAGIRVDLSIKAADKNAADAVGAKLTVASINVKLQQAGLPAATILEAAKTAATGGASSTGNAGGGMLTAIIGAAVGLVVILAIFFLFRWYSRTKKETQRDVTTYDETCTELCMQNLARPSLATEENSPPARVELPADVIYSVPNVTLEVPVLTHNHGTAIFDSTSTVAENDTKDQQQAGVFLNIKLTTQTTQPGRAQQQGLQLAASRASIDSSCVLGSGTFADVRGGTYRFPGQQNSSPVAFKIFRGAQNLAESMRQKIEQELVLGVKLIHPNIVRIYGIVDILQYGPVLVLELCKGKSLRCMLDDTLSSLSSASWTLRCRWLLEIATGMNALHDLKSIIHRDLKTSNVLMSVADHRVAVAKIADFGVAMTIETLRSTANASGSGAGTLAWMAPETFDGIYSEKSDVFSFAILCFEVLSLSLPYAGKRTAEITNLVMERFKVNTNALKRRGVLVAEQEKEWLEDNPIHNRRPDLSQVAADCPQALIDWTKQCWEDNAKDRPTFKECVLFLQRLNEGRPYWGVGGLDQRLVLLDGKERDSVVAAFMESLTNYMVTVHSVERVQNSALWDPFMAKKRSMMQRDSAHDHYEMVWLFHGTDENTVSKIVAQGFDRNFSGKNATVYGKGAYFAVDSEYSARDSYSRPNAAGDQFMFAARVMVGEYCKGKEDAPAPDVYKGNELYDTTVDDVQTPKIFVTYRDGQAYPQYLIRYTKR